VPINIIIGLLSLAIALTLYSIAVWGAFRAHTIRRGHVTLLWTGFFFDVLATCMMAIAAGGLDLTPLSDMLHTVIALLAMAGMAVFAFLATRALSAADEATRAGLARWAPAPWVLWVVVFVWGMVARGSQRMG
jgi:uncharacterized repeat protein (TIGR03987 family)